MGRRATKKEEAPGAVEEKPVEVEAKVKAETSPSGTAAPEPTAQDWPALEKRLTEILKHADLSQLTTKAVRLQLEAECAVSLAAKSSKEWIKDQISKFTQPPDPPSRKRKAATAAADKAKGGDKEAEDLTENPAHPPLSDEMAAVVGVNRATHFRLVKLLWIYIKEHELQDPSDRRNIRCDAKLKRIFNGVATVTAFSMAKHLGRHILAQDADADESAPTAKKRSKKATKPVASSSAGDKGGDKDADDLAEDPAHPPLSDEMAAVVGVRRATRFRLVKLLWIYIKEHELQDPSDRRNIRCDAKLKRIFNGLATVTAFSMSKYLGPHILPR